MSKIIICKGLPASGKSTWAKDHVSKNKNWKRVNKDDLRSMVQAGEWSPALEKQVLEIRDHIITSWLSKGLNVIVDDTNLNPVHERDIRAIAEKFGAQVSLMHFDIDVEEAIKRDLKRQNSVGESVIRKMYDDWVRPKNAPIVQDATLSRAIIVDIDGTIAQMDGRKPFDWELVGTDKPKPPIIDIVRRFAQTHRIIFMSGRDSVCKTQTVQWLIEHVIQPHFVWELHMRTQNDNRKDSIVKRELFDQHVNGRFYVDFVLDDRDQVVEMWRKDIGLVCLQVDYGNF
jgi:predicted kinase